MKTGVLGNPDFFFSAWNKAGDLVRTSTFDQLHDELIFVSLTFGPDLIRLHCNQGFIWGGGGIWKLG